MRHDVKVMEIMSSVASGAAMKVEEFESAGVFVGSTAGFTATVVIEGRVQRSSDVPPFSPSEWVQIASVTAASMTTIPPGYTHVRCRTSAYTSGTLVAAVSGKNSRTDCI